MPGYFNSTRPTLMRCMKSQQHSSHHLTYLLLWYAYDPVPLYCSDAQIWSGQSTHTKEKGPDRARRSWQTQAEHPWRSVPCICKRNQQVNAPLSIQFVPLSRQTDSPDQVSLPLHLFSAKLGITVSKKQGNKSLKSLCMPSAKGWNG